MGEFTDKLKHAAEDIKDTFTNEDNSDPRDDRINRNDTLIRDNERGYADGTETNYNHNPKNVYSDNETLGTHDNSQVGGDSRDNNESLFDKARRGIENMTDQTYDDRGLEEKRREANSVGYADRKEPENIAFDAAEEETYRRQNTRY